eukprot:361095-Chlamydomonas_euryale.AAC.19
MSWKGVLGTPMPTCRFLPTPWKLLCCEDDHGAVRSSSSTPGQLTGSAPPAACVPAASSRCHPRAQTWYAPSSRWLQAR